MRDINWDEPLTEDDKTWLAQRMTPDLKAKIDANQARFAEVEELDDDDELDDDVEDNYDSWKVAELKAEAQKRQPAIDTTGMTKKDEFIAALRTWDATDHDE